VRFDSIFVTSPFSSARPGALLVSSEEADTPFDLMIRVKVHLRQRNPPPGKTSFQVRDAGYNKVQCVPWTAGEWDAFTYTYRQQVNACWDQAFLLISPPHCRALQFPDDGAERRRRNVATAFRIQLTEARGEAHVSIPVVRVAPGVTFFQSHLRLYDNLDVQPMVIPDGANSWDFYTAPHEVGHLLFLGHVNEASPQCKGNQPACYGVTPAQRQRGMGEGPMLSLKAAEPWLRRAARHTLTLRRQWHAEWLSTEARFRGAEHIR